MPREDKTKHKRIDPKKDFKLRDEVIVEPSRPVPKYGKFVTPPPTKKSEPRKNKKRLPPKEDNYGQFSKGGEAKTRGMGCAIKGGKFEGVF